MAVVEKLVLGQAPLTNLPLHRGRHPRIVGQKPEQPLLVGLVLGDDLPPTVIAGFGIVVVHPDVVEPDRTVVVAVGLAVGNRVELLEHLPPAGLEHPQQEIVAARVVALGPRNRQPVAGIGREAEPKAIGLNLSVGCPKLPRRGRADQRQQSARRIAGLAVRTDRHGHRPEMMRVVEHSHLHAVVLLAVGGVGLAAHGVLDAGRRHQVAFVGRVEKHSAPVCVSGERGDRLDPAIPLGHAPLPLEPLVADHRDPVLPDKIVESLLGHVGLEHPHRAGRAVDRRRALAPVAIVIAGLPLPGFRPLVVLPDVVIELAGQSADHGLIAGVGHAQAAAREPAQMPIGRNNDDRFPHPGRLHGRRDRGACAAVDHEVVHRVGNAGFARRPFGRGRCQRQQGRRRRPHQFTAIGRCSQRLERADRAAQRDQALPHRLDVGRLQLRGRLERGPVEAGEPMQARQLHRLPQARTVRHVGVPNRRQRAARIEQGRLHEQRRHVPRGDVAPAGKGRDRAGRLPGEHRHRLKPRGPAGQPRLRDVFLSWDEPVDHLRDEALEGNLERPISPLNPPLRQILGSVEVELHLEIPIFVLAVNIHRIVADRDRRRPRLRLKRGLAADRRGGERADPDHPPALPHIRNRWEPIEQFSERRQLGMPSDQRVHPPDSGG